MELAYELEGGALLGRAHRLPSRVRTSRPCFLNTFTSWPQLSRFLCTDEAFLSKECIETSEG